MLSAPREDDGPTDWTAPLVNAVAKSAIANDVGYWMFNPTEMALLARLLREHAERGAEIALIRRELWLAHGAEKHWKGIARRAAARATPAPTPE